MSAVAQRFGSGQSVRRIEDPALVAGQGRFADDLSLPGQAWLSIQRSPTRMRASPPSTRQPHWRCPACWRCIPAPTWSKPGSSR